MTDVTHIRRDDGRATLCGAPPLESIDARHMRERVSSEAIAGHIARLPNPLCAKCRATFGMFEIAEAVRRAQP